MSPTKKGYTMIKGINLEQTSDYSNSKFFADVMKTRRAWAPPTVGPWASVDSVPVDSNGWPMTDCSVLVFTGLDHAEGVYKFSCIKKCTLEIMASNAKITNLVY